MTCIVNTMTFAFYLDVAGANELRCSQDTKLHTSCGNTSLGQSTWSWPTGNETRNDMTRRKLNLVRNTLAGSNHPVCYWSRPRAFFSMYEPVCNHCKHLSTSNMFGSLLKIAGLNCGGKYVTSGTATTNVLLMLPRHTTSLAYQSS